MSEIIIRSIEAKDVIEAVDLIVARLCFERPRLSEERTSDWTQRYDDIKELGKSHKFYIAEIDGKIVGTGGLQFVTNDDTPEPFPKTRLELRAAFTHPEYRGRKIGDLIYAKRLDDAMQTSENYIYGNFAPFPRTQARYKSLGFIEYPGDGMPAPWSDGINVTMRKRIR